MTSLFLLSTRFSSGPIFQHHHFIIHTLFWDQCSDFLDIAQLLSLQLLKQCNVAPRLKTSLHKFYGRYHVDRYVFLYLTSSRWSLRIPISHVITLTVTYFYISRHHVDRYVFLYLTSSRWSLRIPISHVIMLIVTYFYISRHHVDRYVFLYLTSSRWSLRIPISHVITLIVTYFYISRHHVDRYVFQYLKWQWIFSFLRICFSSFKIDYI
jgi:hypothetical protein